MILTNRVAVYYLCIIFACFAVINSAYLKNDREYYIKHYEYHNEFRQKMMKNHNNYRKKYNLLDIMTTSREIMDIRNNNERNITLIHEQCESIVLFIAIMTDNIAKDKYAHIPDLAHLFANIKTIKDRNNIYKYITYHKLDIHILSNKSIAEIFNEKNNNDNNGLTLFEHTIISNNIEIAKLMLPCNSIDGYEYINMSMTLHKVLCNREYSHEYSHDMIKLLLAYGANVFEKDGDGRMPMFCAAQRNDITAARLLAVFGSGVDADAQDYNGDTPVTVAFELEHHDFIKQMRMMRQLVDV
jgi:hypothetical protein